MRGVVGEPLLVGKISEAVVAALELSLCAPPAIALGDHVERVGAPVVEVSDDGDGADVRPEELELDDAIPGYACHSMMPFVTMPFQSLCQRVTNVAVRSLVARATDEQIQGFPLETAWFGLFQEIIRGADSRETQRVITRRNS